MLLLFAVALHRESWFREYCRLTEGTGWIQGVSAKPWEWASQAPWHNYFFMCSTGLKYKTLKSFVLLNVPKVHPLTLRENSVMNLYICKAFCDAFKKYWDHLLCLKAERFSECVTEKQSFKTPELSLQITKTCLQTFFLIIWIFEHFAEGYYWEHAISWVYFNAMKSFKESANCSRGFLNRRKEEDFSLRERESYTCLLHCFLLVFFCSFFFLHYLKWEKLLLSLQRFHIFCIVCV